MILWPFRWHPRVGAGGEAVGQNTMLNITLHVYVKVSSSDSEKTVVCVL